MWWSYCCCQQEYDILPVSEEKSCGLMECFFCYGMHVMSSHSDAGDQENVWHSINQGHAAVRPKVLVRSCGIPLVETGQPNLLCALCLHWPLDQHEWCLASGGALLHGTCCCAVSFCPVLPNSQSLLLPYLFLVRLIPPLVDLNAAL